MMESLEDRSRDLQVLVASSFLTFLENFLRGNPFSHLCHVLLHLRHLYCRPCPLFPGFPLRERRKKTGDKRLNERETMASTCQGNIERSTRQTLGDPHREQYSVKEFCCIFLSLLSSWFVRVVELRADLPARNALARLLRENGPLSGTGNSADCPHQLEVLQSHYSST